MVILLDTSLKKKRLGCHSFQHLHEVSPERPQQI